ncbi:MULTISPECIES: hypothetical protein [Pseudomonas]|jgi:hypothetical protein|uniref:Uncharacterized protein n=2 Tax=Pseudomonas putida TaxID=303 RepID=A0A1L7NNX5_PSEPU|nr:MULTISPECIES: hypothetical protein [Pseudomonas]AGN82370.1 hypothetical protein L483_15615 [Pseudomonas putida H8234]ELS0927157.1 hypothetical protein [Pseudomonas putida]ENY77268.1 hypothetical protein C206_13079 [Pseudomonas putida TRO1]KYC18823.1 hypothetical protein WM94_19050 [Pseudomonas sp. ABFPK]MBA1319796.1 hypothetical protein [Pseudomonas monteilii]
MADMLTHHFTIVQHKYLFVSEEREAFWVSEGLNPSEAEDLALIPVIALTLNVPGLDLYHQRFFKRNDKISIANFLYEAWASNPFLKGIPDQLCIDEELLSIVPLKGILQLIDPDGQLKEIVTDAGATFGASKAQAHEQSVIYWEDFELLRKPASVDSLLNLIGKKVSERQSIFVESSRHDKRKDHLLEQHRAISPSLPSISLRPDEYFRLDTDWVTKESSQVPMPATGKAYCYSEENDDHRWIHWLFLQDEDEEPNGDGDGEAGDQYKLIDETRHYWSPEAKGLIATLNALAYPIAEYLPEHISSQALRSFMKGRVPLSITMTKDLLRLVKTLPIVIYPKTIEECTAAFGHITRHGHCKYMFELTGGEHASHEFRFFAGNAPTSGPFFIVIQVGSMADDPMLKSALFCKEDDLDIGHAGFAALSYWVEKLPEFNIKGICTLVLDMVEKMLHASMKGRKN